MALSSVNIVVVLLPHKKPPGCRNDGFRYNGSYNKTKQNSQVYVYVKFWIE